MSSGRVMRELLAVLLVVGLIFPAANVTTEGGNVTQLDLWGTNPSDYWDGFYGNVVLGPVQVNYTVFIVGGNVSLLNLQGQAFNFGLNDPKSVLEVTRMIISLSDHPDLEPIVQNQASNEIQDQYLCSDKAQEILGWQPQHSMAQGLEQTIAWYRTYLQQEGLLA